MCKKNLTVFWKIYQFHRIPKVLLFLLRLWAYLTHIAPPPPSCWKWFCHTLCFSLPFTGMMVKFWWFIQNSCEQAVLTIQNLALYLCCELSNCHLKTQKWFSGSFTAPETGRNLSDKLFAVLSCNFSAQDGDSELNQMVRTAWSLGFWMCHQNCLPCPWTKWRHKTYNSFMKSQCNKIGSCEAAMLLMSHRDVRKYRTQPVGNQ
jgi:hypothetical protein